MDDVEVRRRADPVRRKGGIIVDPHRLSRRELEALTRRYVAEIADAIGPDKDVPPPT